MVKSGANQWTQKQTDALYRGFRELGWDPETKEGRSINAVIKSEPEIFKLLQHWFSKADGGSKKNNNQIYEKYKTYGAKFRQNESVEGGRAKAAPTEQNDKKRAAFSDDFDNEDDEEEEGGGKEAEMPSSAKKSPMPKSASKMPPNQEMDGSADDLEFTCRRMSMMSLSNDVGTCGFNFNCLFPHFWWTYTHNNTRYLKFEFLLWACNQEDVQPKISTEGDCLYLSNKILEQFISLKRVFLNYRNNLGGGNYRNCTSAMFVAAKEHINYIEESHEMEDINPVIKIKLPFNVIQTFVDPFADDGRGYKLCSYPLKGQNNKRFFVYHVGMQEAGVRREKVRNRYVETDLSESDASDEEEEDEEDEMGVE